MASSTEQDLPAHTTGPAAGAPRRITDFAPTDAAAVATMFNGSDEGWPGGFNHGVPMTAEQVLRDQTEGQRLATLIAWEGDTATGYCSLYDYPSEAGVAGYVGLLNVATAYHGRGYGRDLLKEALRRIVAMGYRRLDLHTWPGNMKAVPLYKKSGYFWVPESDVHMENYLPLLLGTPALSDFWAEADPYSAQIRDLSVQEDLYLDGAMRVYPYEFRHGDRYVRATIDAAARGLTALETERWRVSCAVDDHHLIVGRHRTVRWEVENRSGRPLPLTLLATAENGVRLHKEETVMVEERYVAEAQVHATPDYQAPPFGQRPPHVASVVLLDGLPVRLDTGVEVQHPIAVRFDPQRISLIPGRPHDVVLRVRNNMDERAVARLTLAPSPGLAAVPADGAGGAAQPLEIPLEAESYGGATLRLSAQAGGAHTLDVRPVVENGAGKVEMALLQLPVPAAGPGELVALTTEVVHSEHVDQETRDGEVRVEGATHRLVVRLREGRFHLEDARSGAYLVGGIVLAGPPFTWSTQPRVRHEATFERRDGALAVILRGRLPHLPDLVVEHELCLAPDGLLRVTTALANAGTQAREAQGAVWLWNDKQSLPTVVVPSIHGVVATSDVEFPDWYDLEMQDPANFAEGWIARQGDGRVAAMLWSEARRLQTGEWELMDLRQTAGTLQPGERRLLPPVYIFTGPGDWRTVRARWRALLRPDAPPHDPAERDVVELTATPIPSALLAGHGNRAILSSVASREAAGELAIEAPAGWEISPSIQEVSGLRVDRPYETRLDVRRSDGGARAAAVRAYLRTERAVQLILDGAALDLGSGAGRVAITEETWQGQRVLNVDNGYLRLRLAPAFLGSVIALETAGDGVNHLLSAFPSAREFGWLRPWYGGLHAAIYQPGPGEFANVGRLYEETFTAEEVTQGGHDGRVWRGIEVRSALRGKGLRGLELGARYLTLPDSNLVAARVAVRNHTGATLTVETALAGYFQPDGTVDGAELLIGGAERRRLLRAQRTEDIAADGWIGVRNPAGGRTLALVCGAREAGARVVGIDWGTLGAHAGARFTLRVTPDGEQGAWSYLALARDEDEARAYRVLTDAQGLP